MEVFLFLFMEELIILLLKFLFSTEPVLFLYLIKLQAENLFLEIFEVVDGRFFVFHNSLSVRIYDNLW